MLLLWVYINVAFRDDCMTTQIFLVQIHTILTVRGIMTSGCLQIQIMVAFKTTVCLVAFFLILPAKVAVILLYITKCFWRWGQIPVQPASVLFVLIFLCTARAGMSCCSCR